MSNSSIQNPHSAIAHQLAHPVVLTTEEKLFRAALKDVEERRKRKHDLPNIFDNLNHARTIDDVKYLVENERASNMVWKESLGRSWLEIFGKYAEYVWSYKVVLDAVVTRSADLAAPIWGTITFVISVFKDIGVAIEYIGNVERTLTASIRRFKRYMDKNVKISTDLQEALLEYYREVIDFFVDVHKEFSQCLTSSAFRIMHRTLKEKLKTFYNKIHPIINDVDKGANIDSMQDIKQELVAVKGTVNKMSVSPSVTSAGALSPAMHMVHGLPQMSRNFTGRQQDLGKIWNLLHRTQQNCQRKVAVHGMGGIGKTQILLKYAYDHIQAAALPQPYDCVLWINALSERAVATTLSSFMEINGFPEQLINNQGEICYNSFFTRLKQHAKSWLLIFDNVVDSKHVQTAIPPGNDGHILFSTREELIASHLSDKSDNVEIAPMDQATSVTLVSRLAQLSKNVADRDADTINKVAEFAGGLPLLIEQIVHNAILGRQSLAATLEDARSKEKLLEQRNRASLHEDDLSLGALVLQTFDRLSSQFPKAEALLKILAYLEPSSIPISLFSDCIGRVQEILDRMCTYDRGAVVQVSGRQYDRTARLEVPGPSLQVSNRHRFRSWSPFKRSRSSHDLGSRLPLDDIEPASSLRNVCGPGTPLGQLFENKIMLDGAFEVLVNAAIIRRLNNNELWMHDRISEVAKVVIAGDTVQGQHMALAAATMVYIASPTPGSGTFSRTHPKLQYLSHTMACHANLKDLGILNNCSIGPELSHNIASALEGLGYGMLPYGETGIATPTKEQSESRAQVTHFYQDAYAGYMAGWRRLKTYHNINDKQIVHHTRMDREYEESFGDYYIGDFMKNRQRLGRNAPWRAIQIACRLSDWLRQDSNTVEQALSYLRAAIKSSTIIFGPNDKDTVYLKRQLYDQLRAAGRWEDAYDVGITSLKDWLHWRPGDKKHNSKIDFKNLWKDYQVAVFADELSICCMIFANDGTISQNEAVSWAREAAMWTETRLRQEQWFYGDDFKQQNLTSRLAEAYERIGDPRAAIFWYGQTVFCVLAHTIWEYEEWDSGPGWGMAMSGGEPFIRKAVKAFEEAMLRFVGEGKGKLGKFEDLDIDLHKYLCVVQSKISIWRYDRELHGVWDPRKEERDKLQREFDEREAVIRAEEEKMYGYIPPLHEAFYDEDGNLIPVGVKETLAEPQNQDSSEADERTLEVVEEFSNESSERIGQCAA